MEFLQALKNRRSIYNLGTNVNLSNKEITSIISDCLKYSPSAFNYPTTNVIIAFGEKHQQIWQITTDILKEKLAKKEETFSGRTDFYCFDSGHHCRSADAEPC